MRSLACPKCGCVVLHGAFNGAHYTWVCATCQHSWVITPERIGVAIVGDGHPEMMIPIMGVTTRHTHDTSAYTVTLSESDKRLLTDGSAAPILKPSHRKSCVNCYRVTALQEAQEIYLFDEGMRDGHYFAVYRRGRHMLYCEKCYRRLKAIERWIGMRITSGSDFVLE